MLGSPTPLFPFDSRRVPNFAFNQTGCHGQRYEETDMWKLTKGHVMECDVFYETDLRQEQTSWKS